MKKIYLLGLAALGLLTASCLQEEFVQEKPVAGNVTVMAKMEESVQTRTTVEKETEDDDHYLEYKVLWAEGDQFSAFTTKGKNTPFTLTDGAGEMKGVFTGNLDTEGGEAIFFAVYPYNSKHDILEEMTVHLPAEYGSVDEEYKANTNAVMLASAVSPFDDADIQEFTFSHLGGVLSVSLKGLPANAKGVVLTANKGITGDLDYTLSDDGETIMTPATLTETNNSVTINFKPEDAARDEVFYFPLPVGTYKFKVEYINEADEKVLVIDSKAENAVTRANLLIMPEFLVGSAGGKDLLLEAVKKDNPMTSFTLTENITLTEPLPIEKAFTLNLNGNEITFENSGSDKLAALDVKDGGNLTVNGDGAVKVTKDGDLVLYLNANALATINGGSFKGGFDIATVDDNGAAVNVRKTYLTIAGGSFIGYNPATDARFKVGGLSVEKEAGIFSILPGTGGASSKTVTLTENLTVLSPIVVSNLSITINMGEYTITLDNEGLTSDDVAVFYVQGSASVGLKPGVDQVAYVQVKSGSNHSAIINRGTGTVTINPGVTIVGTDVSGGAPVIRSLTNSSKFTIKGGVLTSPRTDDVQYKLMDVSDDVTAARIINIQGGIFNGQNPALGDNSDSQLGNTAADNYKKKIYLYGGNLAFYTKVFETKNGYEVFLYQSNSLKLDHDITIVSPIIIDDGATHTFELTYYTITLDAENADPNKLVAAIDVKSGNLTINATADPNGKMGGVKVRHDADLCAVAARDGATVNINNGVFVGHTEDTDLTSNRGGVATIYSLGGAININGGTFQGLIDEKDPYMLLNAKNDAGKTCITVSGGKFYGQNPALGDDSEKDAETKTLIVLGRDKVIEEKTDYYTPVDVPMQTVYLKANADWRQKGRNTIAVYAWGDASEGGWYTMTEVEQGTYADKNIYSVNIPQVKTGLIFASFASGQTVAFGNEAYRTGDLTVGGECYTLLNYGSKGLWLTRENAVEFDGLEDSTSGWTVVGYLNGWDNTNKTYALSKYDGKHDVIFGLTLEEGNTEFKFVQNTSWDTQFGQPSDFTFAADKALTLSSDKETNNNITVTPGTYDVYLDVADSTVYFMTPGKTPNDISSTPTYPWGGMLPDDDE